MIQQVTLPALGETVDTSIIERWLKKEGDTVNSGDILCEITTDKATLEVESYYTGTLLKIVAAEGTELPVGALIAVVGDPGEAIPDEVLAEAAPAASAEAEAAPSAVAEPVAAGAAPSAAAPAAPRGRLLASPRARRRARDLGIALAGLRGTGPGGRIVEADVVAVAPSAGPRGGTASTVKASPVARKLAERQGVDLASVRGTGPGGKILKADVLAAGQAPAVAPGTVVPLTAMRRIVAERMLHSKQTIPCYYLQMEADMTDLAELRSKLNAGATNGKVSFNDFIMKAAALALKAFPQVNSRWTEGGIERRGAAHVGLAVALDEGLIVPVVRNADTKTLQDIACETADFAQRARSKKLLPDEYQDGCLTVSNLGMFGIRNFIPVVNPGESAILGLGVIQDCVVHRQGGIQVRKMMSMTLSVDHRLVDGAVGAQFLEMIRDLLEAPQKLAAE
jgi:pyruvate dehydrogenase E2 component (dihydrolipoamide acetyltransferase)